MDVEKQVTPCPLIFRGAVSFSRAARAKKTRETKAQQKGFHLTTQVKVVVVVAVVVVVIVFVGPGAAD